jgi:hypothetical protein
MAEPDYKKLAKDAAMAVDGLPDLERGIAYTKILDELLARARGPPGGGQAAVPRAPAVAGGRTAEAADDPVAVFLNSSVDASQYVELFRSKGRLVMKCLAVLKLARDEFGVDGLGPSALEEILKKKFRASGVHRGNISRDLGRSLQFVSPIHRDNKPVYLLTAKGEEELKLEIAEKPG